MIYFYFYWFFFNWEGLFAFFLMELNCWIFFELFPSKFINSRLNHFSFALDHNLSIFYFWTSSEVFQYYNNHLSVQSIYSNFLPKLFVSSTVPLSLIRNRDFVVLFEPLEILTLSFLIKCCSHFFWIIDFHFIYSS